MADQWQVVYYVSPSGNNPVKEFLDAAKPLQKAKVLRILFHIHEYGLQVATPHIKKLAGTPLWEIRILGEDGVRVLYVTQSEKRIVLLHAFYKKTQKTLRRDIAVALSRYKELT